MSLDYAPPSRIYRYSSRVRLERALELGESRLNAASSYKDIGDDKALQDNELVRDLRSSFVIGLRICLPSVELR